jgi:alkylated DNA repair dioxygenase AlkB
MSRDTSSAWNGNPLPDHAEHLVLPDGRRLEDAVIWPSFCQDELDLDPGEMWAELLALPTWPSDREIPFRASGDDPHWISGAQRALRYRGNEIKRDKIWCQSDYAHGLRRYRYTGWSWSIGPATHAVEHLPPVARLAERLNVGLVRAGHHEHNHWICTRYADQDDGIGYHSDKDADFAPGSYFIVIKFGAPRPFAFRLPGAKEPFFSKELAAGTAVFVRCKTPGAANDLVQHGVPQVENPVGISGSIVSRCIETVVPWERVRREAGKRGEP